MKSERSTSSAASGASPSGSGALGASRQPRTARSSRTAKKSSRPECGMDLWILPQSVETFASWTEGLLRGSLTLYVEASPAKTSRPPASGSESRERKAASGEKWQGWFAKFDPDTCLWKTSQTSLFGGLE